MKAFKVAEDEKCGSCNWRVQNLYLMAPSYEEAMKIYRENERGLCGDCFAEMLVNGQYEILRKKGGGGGWKREDTTRRGLCISLMQ